MFRPWELKLNDAKIKGENKTGSNLEIKITHK